MSSSPAPSGAIGRPLVPKLVAAGHAVTGMTGSDAKAEHMRRAGAQAAVVDVFDGYALRATVDEASPEVVVHELTALPDRLDFRKKNVYEPTNGPGRHYGQDGAMVASARRRRLPVVGYNVTDDEFAPTSEWV